MDGIVQKFSVLKGYGWILADYKTRLFFHVSQWSGNAQPQVGQGVRFEVAAPRKPGQNPQAVNVTPVVECVGGGAK